LEAEAGHLPAYAGLDPVADAQAGAIAARLRPEDADVSLGAGLGEVQAELSVQGEAPGLPAAIGREVGGDDPC
jgi:hypothetical protein